MTARDEKTGGGRAYRGVDWRKESGQLPVRESDVLLFCDLRNCELDELNLASAEFFGCLLNGASFRKADLTGAQFTACFSADSEDPTNFREADWHKATIVDSHLNLLTDEGDAASRYRWPDSIAEVFSGALSEDSGVRYAAVSKSGEMGDTVTAPCLAYLLTDSEWEVRAITLEVLAKLRGAGFPYRDRELLEWMFLRLGDEHPVVEQAAVNLARALLPDRDVIDLSVRRTESESVKEILAGLQAAYNLSRIDRQYSSSVDTEVIQALTGHSVPEIRCDSLQLLGRLDIPSTIPFILERLSDPTPSVRVEALRAIGHLTEPPDSSQFAALLDDEDEDVRMQVLCAIEETGDVRPEYLTKALLDDSAEIRRTAKRMLEASEL